MAGGKKRAGSGSLVSGSVVQGPASLFFERNANLSNSGNRDSVLKG